MKRIFSAAILLLLISYVGYIYWPRAINESALARQLEGNHCRFAYEIDQCTQRGLDPLRSLFIESHDCDLWAVQCLTEFRSAKSNDLMIWVLEHKTDVETCDGIRPIRSYAVRYLSENGDLSTIPHLIKLKDSNPVATLSGGASGCTAKPENVDKIQEAISAITNR